MPPPSPPFLPPSHADAASEPSFVASSLIWGSPWGAQVTDSSAHRSPSIHTSHDPWGHSHMWRPPSTQSTWPEALPSDRAASHVAVHHPFAQHGTLPGSIPHPSSQSSFLSPPSHSFESLPTHLPRPYAHTGEAPFASTGEIDFNADNSRSPQNSSPRRPRAAQRRRRRASHGGQSVSQHTRGPQPHQNGGNGGGPGSNRTSGHYNGDGTHGGGGGTSVRDYNRRISACARRRDLNGALQALAEVDQSPTVERNLFTYNAAINALVMCSQYARADQLWGEMLSSGIKPNLVTYNTMLKSCFSGADSDVDRAFALVHEMEANDIAADRVTLNSVINSCVAAGRVEDARKVYEQMRSRNIEPDDFTFTTLAKAGAAQNNVDMLDALLVHQLNHHTALQRQRAAVHQSSCVNPGLASDRDMQSTGFQVGWKEPGKSFAGNGRVQASDRNPSRAHPGTGIDLKSSQICPVAYNAIADAYIRCGHPRRALDLLNRMRDPESLSRGLALPKDCIPVAPDVQTFNVKLKALREAGASANEAFSALEEMGNLDLETDHITLLTLADLCCRRGEMGLAEGVLRVATSADVREVESGAHEWSAFRPGTSRFSSNPSQRSMQHSTGASGGAQSGNRRNNNQPRNAKANASLFNALIRGYSSLDPPNVEAAVALYVEMRRYVDVYRFSFYAPDAVTYTMLVDSFARVGDSARAEQIITEMEAAGPASTSVVAYNAFLKANRGNGSEKAFEIFERIKARGLKPDVVTFNTMCDFLSTEENGVHLAEQLVREMPQFGLRPDLLTFNTLLKGAARSKGYNNNPSAALNSAFHWLRELRRCGLRPDEFTFQSMTAACAAAGDAPRALEFFRCVEEERARRVRGGLTQRPASSTSLAASRSTSASNLSGIDLRPRSTASPGTGDTSLGDFMRASSPPVNPVSPHEVGIHSSSVSEGLSQLGAGSGLGEGYISMTNGSRVRSGSADITGSATSACSNDDWMLLAHPAAYVALMRAFLSSGQPDGIDATLRLRDEMVERGLELGRPGYTAVADAYAERSDFQKVEETLREMIEREPVASGPQLGPVHHSIRMKALCNAGRIDDAISILPECENPDTGVFNTLLFAAARLKDRDRLLVILRAMEGAGVQPDAITGRALSGLMRRLARAIRSFDDRFVEGITNFVTHKGNDSMGGVAASDVGAHGSDTPSS